MQSDAAETQAKLDALPWRPHRDPSRGEPTSGRRPHQSGHRDLQGVLDAVAACWGVPDAAGQPYTASAPHPSTRATTSSSYRREGRVPASSDPLCWTSKITGSRRAHYGTGHNARPMPSWALCATASSVMTTRAGTPRRGSCKAHPTRPPCFAWPRDELAPRQRGYGGGTARAFMDDVAVATPRTGFMAIAEYIKNIGRTGRQRSRRPTYAPWLDAQTRSKLAPPRGREYGVEFKMGAGPPLDPSAGDTHLMRGVESGAPIGDRDLRRLQRPGLRP